MLRRKPRLRSARELIVLWFDSFIPREIEGYHSLTILSEVLRVTKDRVEV